MSDVTLVSMVDALRPRACRVAELLASRVPEPGLWQGYRAGEGMDGELRLHNLLVYTRPRERQAVLVFRTPQMQDIKQIDWGDPIILEANVTQRQTDHILLDQPVVYEDTLTHHFGKVRSLLEQLKAGFEASLKVGAEAGAQGGIHGITAKVYAEITAKIYGEYQRQWGATESESTTVTKKYTRQVTREELQDGPVKMQYEAIRSLNREKRRIRCDCDYDHSVELIDQRQGMRPENRPFLQLVSDTWADFLSVVQGFAPRDREMERDGRKWIEPTAFYYEFVNNPIRGDALEPIAAPSEGVIETVVEYDNVIDRDIKLL